MNCKDLSILMSLKCTTPQLPAFWVTLTHNRFWSPKPRSLADSPPLLCLALSWVPKKISVVLSLSSHLTPGPSECRFHGGAFSFPVLSQSASLSTLASWHTLQVKLLIHPCLISLYWLCWMSQKSAAIFLGLLLYCQCSELLRMCVS